MAQSSLCLVLLFSAFTIASAVPNPQPSSSDLECSEVDRQRYSDECKITRCRVKELCYDKRLDTWLYRHRNVITCESLECLNGGTPILPYKVKNFLFCCQLEVYRRVDVHSSGAMARPECYIQTAKWGHRFVSVRQDSPDAAAKVSAAT